MQNIWYYELAMVQSSRGRKEKGNGKGVRIGFVLETHSRSWVQDPILHFVVAFKHCSSSFEGEEVPNLLVPSMAPRPPCSKGVVVSSSLLNPLRSQ